MYCLSKLSLIIVTRCNLRCKYCCEYVPQNKPFPDMTVIEEQRILDAAFQVLDYVETLHLTGGGEPFLHGQLVEMIECAMGYSDKFNRLMLFTNCTRDLTPQLKNVFMKYKSKLFIQLSRYGIDPEREESICSEIQHMEIPNRVRKYYGAEQDFGGWVDFGSWDTRDEPEEMIAKRFHNCAVTKVMQGNWRTRDGKVHWCSRSQRGMELGLLPNDPNDYVDLFEASTAEQKREKFELIAKRKFITACRHCSGDQGTDDINLRFAAAEQLKSEV